MVERIDLADGYYTVPGKLVNAVTWLEMRTRPEQPLADPLRLAPVTAGDMELCNRLFTSIGTPYLWTRAYKVPEQTGQDVHIAYDEASRAVGLVEFEGRSRPDVEIFYFGVTPEAVGRGLGRRLMAAALDLAWSSEPSRVWLHTCNFDHPAALRFYKACGFTPYQTGFEIMDDPRLACLVPRSVAPHIPLIEP